MKKVVIIGAGPAGLFCAYHLLENALEQKWEDGQNIEVHLYDQMSSVGRKFLVAGKSGLNLTHSAELDLFSKKYGKDQELFRALLENYSAQDVRAWAKKLGIDTFIGTSGRVFPTQMKAAKMLLNWQKHLMQFPNFHLHLNHRLMDLVQENEITSCHFECRGEQISTQADAVVLSMGGGSWKVTGSDGKWMKLMEKLHVKTEPLVGANCGYETNWSKTFIDKVDRSPLKNIQLQVADEKSRGELMLTPFGVEGTAIYNLSHKINQQLADRGQAIIKIDLKPDLTQEEILGKILNKKSKQSLSNHLRKTLKFNHTMTVLLRELTDKEVFQDFEKLSFSIKNLFLTLNSSRPMDEAISTSGGVSMHEINSKLELKKIPGVYIIGEMLDFHAPTGGYLLQACFSSAYHVAKGITATVLGNHHN
jgi:uncharacterized flavoprotein (TIGR03862 family)